MCLGIALMRMKDPRNACQAYEKAIDLDGEDYMTRLNYAVALSQCGKRQQAQRHLDEYNRLVAALDEEATANFDDDVAKTAKDLSLSLMRA